MRSILFLFFCLFVKIITLPQTLLLKLVGFAVIITCCIN